MSSSGAYFSGVNMTHMPVASNTSERGRKNGSSATCESYYSSIFLLRSSGGWSKLTNDEEDVEHGGPNDGTESDIGAFECTHK